MAEIVRSAIVPIEKVHCYPGNARRGDVDAIAESLDASGQFRPIVVDVESEYILGGNHTWLAARRLGWDKIAVTYVKTKDEAERVRILLADNRTHDLGQYNNDQLVSLLSELGGDLTGTGYTDAALEALLEPPEPPAKTPEAGEREPREITCPGCALVFTP